MAGPRRHEIRALLADLERQGATLVPGTRGTTVRFPDGSSVSVHWTPSDRNAWKPIRKYVRQAGLRWPGDPHRPKKDRS